MGKKRLTGLWVDGVFWELWPEQPGCDLELAGRLLDVVYGKAPEGCLSDEEVQLLFVARRVAQDIDDEIERGIAGNWEDYGWQPPEDHVERVAVRIRDMRPIWWEEGGECGLHRSGVRRRNIRKVGNK